LNRCRTSRVVLLLTWLASAPALLAQIPEDAALDALRTRSAVANDDPAMDAWITARLKKLTDDLQVGVEEAPTVFIQAYRTQLGNAENSTSFKVALLQQTSLRFAAEFEKGQGLQAAVGLALARTLADLKDVGTIGGLTAGLQAKAHPGVRYTCAKAFAALIPAIQADSALTKTTIERLRDAGSQETNGPALRRIYEAMFYKDANLETAATAMLDVLRAQLRLRAGAAPGYNGADEVAFNYFKNEATNTQSKKRLVALLAAHLRMDVERYLTQGISDDERYLLELTIDSAESLLQKLVNPGSTTSIRDALKKAENRDLNLPLELNKWIGTEQTKGFLNGTDWNVPIGAPIPD
jgi:hypothetical protein